jgi:hypothetical protein
MAAGVFETAALVNTAWEATRLAQSRLAQCTIDHRLTVLDVVPDTDCRPAILQPGATGRPDR